MFRNRSTQQWQDADNTNYLHPFTDYKSMRETPARVVARAEGVYMWDVDGNRVIDSMAGLGCVAIGYGNKKLAAVAAAQLEKLSYCHSFFRTTNREAIELSEKLVAISPPGMSHVFFTTSGSEANETAIRLARRYWDLRGCPERKVIIGRDNGYHGSTMATASLSGINTMHGAGGDLPLPGFAHIGCPDHFLFGAGESSEAFGLRAAGWLEDKILELGPDKVAAFVGEPIQGAGGAILPPESYWPEISRICRKYDVLLVSDEVLTGFGRTGHQWGMQGYGAIPDILTCAKALTSAYVPLSATIISQSVADVLIEQGGEWYHGFTYSGFPMACAVALANLAIIEDEDMIGRISRDIGPYFESRIQELNTLPIVVDTQARGLFAGIKLGRNATTRTLFDEELGVGPWCMQWALDNGLALRAMGDTMMLLPPLVVTREQIDEIVDISRATFEAAWRHFS
ncbi:aminotransferase [Sphingosinicella xenopeptidilytica]|uniref:Aminotransferase n=1 Tax=Sphingosinicella xenopeptidilytica TaxID=364098 RepID=A0ABW3C8B8_SPHXN